MITSRRQALVPALVAPAAARLTSVYQTAAHDVLLPLVSEISPPPKPHARGFRDRVHSPLGRFIARFLARWLVIAPLPQPVQQLALLWPVSILAPLANALEAPQTNPPEGEPSPESVESQTPSAAVSCVGNADPTRPERIFSLSLSSPPAFLGYVEGVNGKIALGENGLLFGTAYSRFGAVDPNGLNGVRVAALGNMTFIKEVKEDPVILAFDRKSVEEQKIKYRALFPRDEIKRSEIEILKSEPSNPEGVVVKREPVTVGEDGTGEYTLPAGLEHALGKTMRVRLAINRDVADAEKPFASARLLSGEAWKIVPAIDEIEAVRTAAVVDIDEKPLLVATNQAVLKRVGERRDPPYRPPVTHWVLEGWHMGDVLPPINIRQDPATPIAEYYPSTEAEKLQQAVLYTGDIALAKSGVFSVTAGQPKDANIYSLPAPQSPTDKRNEVPADRTTEVTLVLENIKDAFGNVVREGTVTWSVEGDEEGEILDEETQIVNGKTTSRYRAGIEPKKVTIGAQAEFSDWSFELEQVELEVEMTQEQSLIRATVKSAAGPPRNSTVISFDSVFVGTRGEVALTDGTATANIIEPEAPASEHLSRLVTVFATVGRARGILKYDRALGPGLKIRTDDTWIVGDAPSAVPGSDGQPVFKSTSRAHVEGGQPGETVRVELGSPLYPVVQSQALFQMEALDEQRVARSVYGNSSATAAADVAVDTEVFASGRASYRFAGTGGLTMSPDSALSFASDFGVTGFVNFDSVSAPQDVVAKSDAWSLRLVIDAGLPRLEFAIVNGGVQKRALSSQAIAASTWYRFSGRLKDGRVHLALTGDEVSGDPSGAPDASESPVLIGPTLVGHLDQLAFIDLTHTPVLAFPNGQTSVDVTLDDQGAAEVSFDSTGVMYDVAPGASGSHMQVPIRITRPPEYKQQGMAENITVEMAKGLAACGTALATGEPPDGTGLACEILVGLVPGTGIPMGGRDITRAGYKFYDGKTGPKAAMVTVGLAMVGIALDAIPGKRASAASVTAARAALEGTEMFVPLVRHELKILLGQGDDIADRGLIRFFEAGANPDARRALLELFVAVDEAGIHAPKFWKRLSKIGDKIGHEQLVFTLNRLARESRFSMNTIGRMVSGLDRMSLPAGMRLTDDALEGMAVFCLRAENASKIWMPSHRMGKMWREINTIETVPPMTAKDKEQVLNNLFSWLKQGDAVRAQIPGWEGFIRKGPGTLFRVGTPGFYHHLEGLADAGFKDLRAVDQAFPGYPGRPDALRKTADTLKSAQDEYKNLKKGELLRDSVNKFGRRHGSVPQLEANVRAAVQRADARLQQGEKLADLVEEEFSRMKYIFRGFEGDHPGLRDQMRTIIEGALDGDLKHLASRITAPNGSFIKFQGKRVPW